MNFLQRLFSTKKPHESFWCITGNAADLEKTKARLRRDFISGNISVGEYVILLEQVAQAQRESQMHSPRCRRRGE